MLSWVEDEKSLITSGPVLKRNIGSRLKLCPPSERVSGHIVFNMDPVGFSGVGISCVGIAFCQCSNL